MKGKSEKHNFIHKTHLVAGHGRGVFGASNDVENVKIKKFRSS